MGPEDPASRAASSERNELGLGVGFDPSPTGRRHSLGHRVRRFAVLPILGAILSVAILFLSSTVPSPGSWHSVGPGSSLTPDAVPSAPVASSFYPYLANASQYPSPDALGVANLTSPAMLASKAGCGGPTAIPLYYANIGYYVGERWEACLPTGVSCIVLRCRSRCGTRPADNT